jgi:hypothetical protein
MQHRLRHIAIVREQQQPLTHHIQSTHVKQLSMIRVQTVVNSRPALRVGACTDRPGQFVQRNPHVRRLLNALTVDFDDAPGWIYLDALLTDHDAVDLYSTLTDQIFTAPTRGEARAGKKLIQANFSRHRSAFLDRVDQLRLTGLIEFQYFL